MRDRRHLTDKELVLAADDEFGSVKLRAHLHRCADCRARAAELASITLRLDEAQRARLDPLLPSITNSRARLLAGISDLKHQESMWPAPAPLLAGVLRFTALALAILVIGALIMPHIHLGNQRAARLAATGSVLPDRRFTPGAVRSSSFQEVCAREHEEVVKTVPRSLQQLVLSEYGIPATRADDYEMDYLITPGLGGKDDISNLWPEPYDAPMWNAQKKDALEERLHEMVCSGQIDLATAQKAISTNWIAAYGRYVRRIPTTG